MYKGKRVKKITHMSKRAALLVLSLVTILTISVSGTLAYLIRKTDEVQNNFIPGTIDTTTDETFDGEKKTDVLVTNGENTGALPVYVRAKVVFAWTDGAGNVLADPVNPADLTITWAGNTTGTEWKKGTDGYYYYSDILYPGESTGNLIESCYPNKGAGPVDAQLQVTILTQSIQAYGTKEAVINAWGETVAANLPDAAVELERPSGTVNT